MIMAYLYGDAVDIDHHRQQNLLQLYHETMLIGLSVDRTVSYPYSQFGRLQCIVLSAIRHVRRTNLLSPCISP